MTHVPDGGGFGARFYKSTAMSAYFAEAVLESDHPITPTRPTASRTTS
jgi:hypothetical protein